MFCRALILLLGVAVGSTAALANPKGASVVSGGITITAPSSTTLDVNQSTNNGIIDWQSFNIATGEKTVFQVPSPSSSTLNRVSAGNPSTIAGQLISNGNLILINPSGIVFANGAQVDANSLLATTSDITNKNFLNGNMKFDIPSASPTAGIVNAGHITVGQSGLAALVAPSVVNSGVIAAKLGKVTIAGAETYTIDFYGDGLINFDVGPALNQAPAGTTSAVTNTGKIIAPGGTVLLTADAAAGLLTNVVDAGGTIAAPTIGQKTGSVTINGGANGALVTGAINVSGPKPGQKGGKTVVTGSSVTLASTANINASGNAGGGTVEVGGGPHGADPNVANAQNATVAAGATINASAMASGNGGTVSVWSNGTTSFNGTILATGGALGGNGGWVETSGHGILDVGPSASVSASAPYGSGGSWLLDPDSNIEVTSSPDGNGTSQINSCPGGTCQPSADNSYILPSTITAALNAGTNVTVTTNNTTGTQSGNITVGLTANGTDGEIQLTAAKTVSLTLDAGGTAAGGGPGAITINSPITDTGSGGALSLVLSAGGAINIANDVTLAGSLNATSGTVGAGAITVGGTVTTGSSNITLNSGASLLTVSDPLYSTGQIALTADTMSLGAQIGGSGPSTGSASQVTLGPSTSGTAVDVTSGAGSGLVLAPSDLETDVYAITLELGNANTGQLSIASALDFSTAHATNLKFDPAYIDLNADVTTSGGQMYLNPVVLGAGVTLTSTAGGNITLGSTVDSGTAAGTYGLTVSTGGTTLFGGNIGTTTSGTTGAEGALSSLSVTGGAATVDGNVQTSAANGGTGNQSYSGALTLGGGGTQTFTTGGGSATFSSTVDAASAGQEGMAVNAGTGTVTFGGAVGGTALASLSDTAGTTAINGGSIRTETGGISLSGSSGGITLGAATNLTDTNGGSIVLSNQVTGGANTLTLTTTGAETLSGFTGTTATNGVTFVAGQSSLTLDGGTYTLKSGSGPFTFPAATVNGTLILGDTGTTSFSALTLGSTAEFLSDTADGGNNGNINFAAINGTQALTVNAGTGTVTFGTNVGATTALLSLAATGATTLDGNVSTEGAQTYNSALTLGGSGTQTLNSNANSTGNGAVTFDGAVNATTAGSQGLAVTSGTGTVTFGGAVGTTALASLSDTAGTTAINGGSITTSGSGGISLSGSSGGITLGAGTTLSAGSQAISLNNQVTDGGNNYSLALSTTGAETLNGVTTTSTLMLNTPSSLTLEGGTYTIGNGSTSYTFPGVATTTNGTLTLGQLTTFDGAVTLGGNTTFSATDTGINFDSTIQATSNGGQSLAITTNGGGTTFEGAIGGGGLALSSLSVDGANIYTNVTTTGAQSYTGAVMIGNPIGPSATVTLATGGASTQNISFSSTVNDASVGQDNLVINAGAGGTVGFGSTVGTNTALASLQVTGATTLGGNVSTEGGQTYNSAVTPGASSLTLNSDANSTGNGAIDFGVQITGGADSLTLTSGSGSQTLAGITTTGNLTLTTIGTVNLNPGTYTIGTSYTFPAATLNAVGGTGSILLGDASTTFGALTLANNATIDSSAANGSIMFGTINGGDTLTIKAGTGIVTLGGIIGASTPLTSLTVTSDPAIDADVTTNGSGQTYNGPISLGGNIVLTDTGGGAIALNGQVTGGADSLTLSTSGAETLAGVTTTSTLTLGTPSLLTLNPGTYTISSGTYTFPSVATTIAATGGTLTFGQSTTFGGAVTVANGATLDSSAANGTLIFSSTVDGSNSLIITSGSGDVTFTGAVGGITPLGLLQVTSTGAVSLDAGVATTSSQTYTTGTLNLTGGDSYTTHGAGFGETGAVVLNGAGTVTVDTTNSGGTPTGATIEFGSGATNGTINGTLPLVLAAGTSGQILLNSQVGGTTPLTSLSATGTTILLDGVTAGSLSLTPTALQLSGNGSTTGTFDINAGSGTVTFPAVATTTNGTLTLDNPTTFAGAVTLGGVTTFNATSLTIIFDSTIDAGTAGIQSLTVGDGTGTVTFDGNVGTTSGALGSLSVTGGTITLGGNVSTSFSQAYTPSTDLVLTAGDGYLTNVSSPQTGATFTVNGPTKLTGTGTATVDTTNGGAFASGANITFDNTIDASTSGGQALTVNAGSSTATFEGAVGSSHPLASLTVTDPVIDANVTTTGGQTYNDPVTLGNTVILSSTANGAIDFVSSIDATASGVQGLTVSTGGTVTYGGVVGGNQPLASLSTSGGAIDINTTGISTAGAQGYTGPITLGASPTLASTGSGAAGNITFNTGTTIDGGFGLTVSTAGAATFDAAVGNGTQLASLSATAGSLSLGALINASGAVTLDSTGSGNALMLPFNITGSTLTLESAAGISQSAGTLTATTLTGSATSVSLGDTNSISSLGAFTSTAGFSLTNGRALTVNGTQTVGANAFSINNGTNLLTVSSPIYGTSTIGLTADTMLLGAQVGGSGPATGSATTVTLQPSTTTRAIDIVGSGGTGLVLTPTSLTSSIDAGTLVIGSSSDTGGITIGSALNFSGAQVTNLKFLTDPSPIDLDNNVTTPGTQEYSGPVTLGATVTLTTTNAAVTFDNTLDATTAGGEGLAVRGGTGTVSFDGAVGSNFALSNLSVTGGAISFTDGAITKGAQSYTNSGTLTLTGGQTYETNANAAGSPDATFTVSGATTLAGTGTVTVDTTGATTSPAGANISFGALDASSAGAQSLTLTAGTGGTISLGAVGSNFALAGLNMTGATTLNGSVSTDGAQTYSNAVILNGSNIVLNSNPNGTSNGAIQLLGQVTTQGGASDALTLTTGTGAETLSGVTTPATLTLGTTESSLTLNAGTYSIGNGTTVYTLPAVPTTVNGDLVLKQPTTFGGAITVASGSTLDSSSVNQSIIFDSTIDSTASAAQALTLNAGNATVTFEGAVGSSHPLASLTVTDPVIDANVTTSGGQTYNDPVTLGNTVILSSTANGAIDFVSSIDATASGVQGLTVSTGGTVTYGGVVGGNQPLASLSTSGGAIDINATGISTTGAQGYTGPITLGASPTLASTGSGAAANITFNTGTTIDGGFGLTVSTAGAAAFDAAVGSITALTSLDVSSTTGSTTLGANVTTAGPQTYAGATTLSTSPITLNSNSAAAHGAIDFGGQVSGSGDLLTLTSGSGNQTLAGVNLGSTGSLTLTTTGTLALNAGNYTFSDGTTAFPAVATVLDGAGAGTLTLGQSTTFNGAVTLGNTATVDGSAANAAIIFANTVNGTAAATQGLTVTAGTTTGTVTFDAAVGGTTSLSTFSVTAGGTAGTASLVLDGGVTTSGGSSAQTYFDTVGNIKLGSGAGATYTTNGGAFTVNSGQTIGTESIALGGTTETINTSGGSGGAITITNNINSSSGTTHPLSLVSGGGAITVGGGIGGGNPLSMLTMNSGSATITLDKGVFTTSSQSYTDGTLALTSGTLETNVSGAASADSTFTQTGALTKLTGATTVTIDTTGAGTSPAGANISISAAGNINDGSAGTHNLVLTAGTGGNITLGPVGLGGALASLTATGNAITLNGGVNTSGAQSYTDTTLTLDGSVYATNATGTASSTASITLSGAVTLGNTMVTLDTTGNTHDPAGANITMNTGATIDGADSLMLLAGTGGAISLGPIGQTTPLANLNVSSAAMTTLNGNVTTSGGETYGSPLTVAAPTTLIKGGTTIVFDDAVTLQTALGVTSTGGSALFDSTINGDFALTVTSLNPSVFEGVVGGSAPLASLTVTDPTLDANVTTVGVQTYNDAVTLGNTITLTTTNSAVTFGSTLDATTSGAQGLTVSAGTGTVTFGGTVGGMNPLAFLTVTAGSIVADGSITVSGAETYNGSLDLNAPNYTAGSFIENGATILTANTTINTSSDNGAIAFQTAGTIDDQAAGTHTLTLNAGNGTITIAGAVGGTAAPQSLSATGGTINLDGSVSTAAAQRYTDTTLDLNGLSYTTTGASGSFTENGATILTSNVTVNTSAGNQAIIFQTGGTIDDQAAGTHTLTLNAGTGTITIAGNVGGTAAPASLSATGGTINLDGNVTTTGAQGYTDTTLDLNAANYTTTGAGGTFTETGATVLTTNVTVNTSARNQAIVFQTGGTIDDQTTGQQWLVLNAGTGGVTVAGAIGGTRPLTALTIEGGSPSLAAVNTDFGNIVLEATAGNLALSAAVNANDGSTTLATSPGQVGLWAPSGNISQSGAGIIYASAVEALAGGTVTLPLANRIGANDNSNGEALTTGTVSGSSASTFELYDTNAQMTVGTLAVSTAGSGGIALASQAGVVTSGGDILLGTTGSNTPTGVGNLTLASNVCAGVSAASCATSVGAHNVALVAAGSIAESTGLVSAKDLLANAENASQTVKLQSANEVGTLVGESGGEFEFVNGPSLTVGTTPVIVGVPAQSNVTAAGDVRLIAGGSLTLATSVSAGATQNAALVAQGGSLTETGGVISASDLIANASGAVVLDDANAVGVLTGQASGGNFQFTNASGLIVGAVPLVGDNDAHAVGSQSNVVTLAGAGDIRIITQTNNLIVVDNVCAGLSAAACAGGTSMGSNNVALVASAGSIAETTGLVSATDLVANAKAAGQTVKLQSANQVGTLVGQSGGEFEFVNAPSLTVGTTPLIVDVPIQSNVTTASGDVRIIAGGALTLATNVTAGAGGSHNAALVATGGSLTEAGGIVTATDLIANASAGVVLDDGNSVGTLAGLAQNGKFQFTDAPSLTVGTVPLVGDSDAHAVGPQSNVVALAGDIRLITTTGANLTLASDVCAGVSGANCASSMGSNNAALVASVGSISETTGLVSATDLVVNAAAANQTVKLDEANQVGTLAGQSGSTFQYTNAIALTVGATPVIVDVPTESNVVTGTGNVRIITQTGNLTLASDVCAGVSGANCASSTGANNVALVATTGSIAETSGLVSATDLVANAEAASQTVKLQDANEVGTLAGQSGGEFEFVDAVALTVGTTPLIVDVPVQSNVATTAGDIRLIATTGNLTLASDVCAGVSAANCASSIGSNNAALMATAGSLSETNGLVSASGLIANAEAAGQTVTLDNGNEVGTLVGQSGSRFRYTNAVALTVGTVAQVGDTPAHAIGPQANVATTAGDVRIRTNTGNLTLVSDVCAGAVGCGAVGANNLALVAAGSLTQTSGLVAANNLIANAGGSIMLDDSNASGFNNLVGTLTAQAASGIAFGNAANLTLAAAPAVIDVAAQSGLASTSGAILVNVAGALTVNNVALSTSGDILVTANGSITTSGSVPLTSGAGNNIVLASGGVFDEASGAITIFGADFVVDATGTTAADLDGTKYSEPDQISLVSARDGGAKNDITFDGSLNGSLVLLSSNGGVISGSSIVAAALGVSNTASGGTAALNGSIAGNTTQTAAETGQVFTTPNNNYRFNGCAIGSVSCTVLPALTPVQPAPITNFAVFAVAPTEEDVDAPLTNIFDEDRLCDELYQSSPDVARQVCQ